MKSVFQTFLNLLLAVSLSAAPVTAALAAASPGGGKHVISTSSESSHAFGLKKLSAPVSCVAVVDGCVCPDNTGCQHVVASTSLALPPGLLEFAAVVGEPPVTGLQENHAGLNLPPESPPPIA